MKFATMALLVGFSTIAQADSLDGTHVYENVKCEDHISVRVLDPIELENTFLPAEESACEGFVMPEAVTVEIRTIEDTRTKAFFSSSHFAFNGPLIRDAESELYTQEKDEETSDAMGFALVITQMTADHRNITQVTKRIINERGDIGTRIISLSKTKDEMMYDPIKNNNNNNLDSLLSTKSK